MILTPSLKYDIFASPLCAHDAHYNQNALAAYAAAVFFSRVRGFPTGEFEVETPRGVYKTLLSGDGGKCEILMRKCKLLYSKSPKTIQNVDINPVDALVVGGTIRALKCRAADGVSDEILHSLACSSQGENIIGSMAISKEKVGYRARVFSLENCSELDFLLAAASISYGTLTNLHARLDLCGSEAQLFARVAKDGALYLSSKISLC